MPLASGTRLRSSDEVVAAALATVVALALTSWRGTAASLGTQAPAAQTAMPGADPARARVTAGADRLYDTARLHRIDIVIAPADAAQIVFRRPDRVRATFTIDGRTIRDVGVRQSGGIYHPYLPVEAKPSLSVKFDEFVAGQTLFDLDKLILKNELQDISFLSEHLTYEVFRRAGLAAPLTAHAQVTINGIDDGIYLMREPVDKSFLARNFGSAFTNGNLYEIENRVDFVAAPMAPKLDDEGKKGRTRADMVALASAVQAATPESFVREVSGRVDLDRLATFLAVETATVHWDSLSFNNNNTYMYAHPKDGRFIFIPWGADQTLGLGRGMMRSLTPQSWLVAQMMSVPTLAARVRAEVTRVGTEPVWNQKVLRDRIAEVARILATADQTGRTASDVARFTSFRPQVEQAIK